MLNLLHQAPILTLLRRIFLAEIILRIPSVDEMTAICKLLVQLTLLISGILELRKFARARKKKANTKQE